MHHTGLLELLEDLERGQRLVGVLEVAERHAVNLGVISHPETRGGRILAGNRLDELKLRDLLEGEALPADPLRPSAGLPVGDAAQVSAERLTGSPKHLFRAVERNAPDQMGASRLIRHMCLLIELRLSPTLTVARYASSGYSALSGRGRTASVTRETAHSLSSSSLRKTSHNHVVFPPCSLRASAWMAPSVTGRRKLVWFESPTAIIPSSWTLAIVASEASISDRAMYTPPCTRPHICLTRSVMATRPQADLSVRLNTWKPRRPSSVSSKGTGVSSQRGPTGALAPVSSAISPASP